MANGLGITFAKANMGTETMLKKEFKVDTYPRLLLWDTGFANGMPR